MHSTVTIDGITTGGQPEFVYELYSRAAELIDRGEPATLVVEGVGATGRVREFFRITPSTTLACALLYPVDGELPPIPAGGAVVVRES